MKITRKQLKQIIKEELSLLEANQGVDPDTGRSWALDPMTGQKHWGKLPSDDAIPSNDGLDNDGDGEVDEEDESYFLMGGTVSELITYLQALDGELPVSCYLGEGPYLTKETTCSFAVLQPGDGTEEAEITKSTFAIICEV